MDRGVFLLSFGLAGIVTVASAAAGQHDGHQAGAAPSAAQVTECRQAQPVITQLLNAALKRLEDARLTNSAAAMRDAADDVQAALVDMRTQLAPCTVMQAAAEAPASPATSTSRQPAAAPARPPVSPQRSTAPAPADSHAGHTAPAAAASRTPAASAPPAASTSGGPTAAAPPTNIAELKCSNAVDPRTALRMLYQGRMYYFCTEASRAEFAKDPSKFVTAPPQATPAHAH